MMMKEFFKVKTIEEVLEYRTKFAPMGTEGIPLAEAMGRILAENIHSDIDLPDFPRSIMDGFAVRGASTFGASEANPAYLVVKGSVAMGESSNLSVEPGEAVRISTGGMLPAGADSVVMVEHTEAIDDTTIEVYRSVAPGQNMVTVGEDIKKGEAILPAGQPIRPQETGLLAALGRQKVTVYKRPVVGIISTGDEIVAVGEVPGPGQIRDVNTYTLMGQVTELGAVAFPFGIVGDDYDALLAASARALDRCDLVLVSGGSSVGVRDFTIDIISAMEDSAVLFHGISISPGKPTILASVQNKQFWGLPGHVVSAMVVFSRIVKPFIQYVSGMGDEARKETRLPARLSRNVASAQGRVDFVRIRLFQENGANWAEPILGKSGLISTMVKADGLIEIGMNTEGLDEGTEVEVILL
ncbi:MAG: gephyrin-like molybdotransferase Glp [Desulfobacteraceae bacterium]|jgi:molybdopterin molybdotransferase|nr:gephyrin-like molybdotransferase Glp [Desulfobacteraceae bacterium]